MHLIQLAPPAAADAYRLVFTAEAFPYPAWWIGLPGLLFVGLGAVLARVPDLWAGGTTGTRGLARPFMAFGALFVLVGTCVPYAAHARVARALRAGAYLTVEGIVRDFEPGSEARHRPERFRVTTADKDYA